MGLWLKQDLVWYVWEFLVRAATTLPLASKLIFCWKLIRLEVDFIFGALRREGKSRTLITFCSRTFLRIAWLASLVGASFVWEFIVGAASKFNNLGQK